MLLTSRFRPADRRGRPELGTVVATQTLEVGVDFTFDALVTEACSWNALVQRLGRLNRDGRSQHGTATIIATWDRSAQQPAPRTASASVYGEAAMFATIGLLRTLHDEADGSPIDLGFEALRGITERLGEQFEGLSSAQPRIGTLTSAQLSLLAQTRPVPDPDVPIDALITGPDAPAAGDVSIAWREDLDIFDEEGVQPRIEPAEVVTVTRNALRAFLRGQKAPTAGLHDAVGGDSRSTDAPGTRQIEPSDFHLIRVWDPQNERWLVPSWQQRSTIENASRLVLKPRLGGYDETLGWTGDPADADAGLDISLQVALHALDRMVSDPAVVRRAPGARVDLVLNRATVVEAQDQTGVAAAGVLNEFAELEDHLAAGVPPEDLDATELDAIASTWADDIATEIKRRAKKRDPSWTDPALLIEVLSSSATSVLVSIQRRTLTQNSRPQELTAHQAQVAVWADADAERAGLAGAVADDVLLAGLHHDEGKRRPEFQHYLGGQAPQVLAKSGGARSGRADLRMRRRCGVEDGWRHEAESVQLTPSVSALTSHLIGSHHGWYRPLLPPIIRADGPGNSGYLPPLAHADDFADLNRRFGVWGLAYLEAVLRLADWRASAAPDANCEPRQVAVSESPKPFHASAPTTTRLTGLHTHPLTGWFATVGLLAAAQDADALATVQWEPLSDDRGAVPIVPVLCSTLSVAELVERIFDDPHWAGAEGLVRRHALSHGLRAKNQKLEPAIRLHGLLLDAEDSGSGNALILGLASDLAATDSGDRLPLAIAPIANNASYPKIAFDRAVPKKSGDRRAVAEAEEALTSVSAGFANDKCDGGMDRSQAVNPAVNGLGDSQVRSSRSALAPLVIYGLAHLGSGPRNGIGVSASVSLTVPLPQRPQTFRELQALTFIGRGRPSWDWASAGLEWIYAADYRKVTPYESLWIGGPRRRA